MPALAMAFMSYVETPPQKSRPYIRL